MFRSIAFVATLAVTGILAGAAQAHPHHGTPAHGQSYGTVSYQLYSTSSYSAPIYSAPVYRVQGTAPSVKKPATTRLSYSGYRTPSYGYRHRPRRATYSVRRPAVPTYTAQTYSVSQYNAVQYSAPHYTAPQYAAPRYSAPQYDTASQYATTQYYSAPQYTAPKYTAPAPAVYDYSYTLTGSGVSAPTAGYENIDWSKFVTDIYSTLSGM